MECFRPLLEHLAWSEHKYLSGIRDSRKAGSLRGMMRGARGVRKSPELIGQRVRDYGYYVEVLREFKKRFRRKRPALFKSGQWNFHQDNAPFNNSSLSQTIWSRFSSRQFFSLSISRDLAPCDFCLFPKLRVVVLRQLRRRKRLWRMLWTRSNRGLEWGLPELLAMVQEVHCSRRRLLRRGLQFHVFTINKVPIRKMSGNLFNDPRTLGKVSIFLNFIFY